MARAPTKDELQKEYNVLEQGLKSDVKPDQHMVAVIAKIRACIAGQMSTAEQMHLLKTSFPRLVFWLMKRNDLGQEYLQPTGQLMQAFVDLALFALHNQVTEATESLSKLFSPTLAFHVSHVAMGLSTPGSEEEDEDEMEGTQPVGEGTEEEEDTSIMTPDGRRTAPETLPPPGATKTTTYSAGLEALPPNPTHPEDKVFIRPAPTGPDVGSPTLMLEIMQYFAASGGLDFMLDRLRGTATDLSGVVLPRVGSNATRGFTKIALRLRDFLVPSYGPEFLKVFWAVATTNLATLDETTLRLEDRKSVADVLKQLDALAHSIDYVRGGERIEKFQLAVALRAFHSSVLERRFAGLAEMKEVIVFTRRRMEHFARLATMGPGAAAAMTPTEDSALPNAAAKWVTTPWLARWILDHDVVPTLFGPNMHESLVKAAPELLRFLCEMNLFTRDMLEMIWASTKDKHESVVHVIWGAIGDLSPSLSLDDLNYLITAIKDIPVADFDMQTIQLVRTLTYSAFQIVARHDPHRAPPPPFIEALPEGAVPEPAYGLDILWNLAQDSTPVSTELSSASVQILVDFLANWPGCKHNRGDFLRRCITALNSGQSVLSSIIIIQQICAVYPIHANVAEPQTQNIVLTWLIEEGHLLDALFADMKVLHKAGADAVAAAGPEVDPAVIDDTIMHGGRVSFRAGLSQRLQFLMYVLNSATNVDPTEAQLDVLWNLYVIDAPTPAVRDDMFVWFQTACNNYMLSDELVESIFANRAPMLSSDSLSVQGFHFWDTFFRAVAETSSKMTITEKPEPHQFIVQDIELDGLTQLWDIALHAEADEVATLAANLLNTLQKQMSVSLKDEAGPARTAYVERTMANLRSAAEKPGAHAAVAVNRALGLLEKFLETFEGSGGSQTHGSGRRGKPITVKFKGYASNLKELALKVRAGDSLKVVRVLVSKELKLPTSSFRLIALGRELKEADDLKSLTELKIHDGHTVHVFERKGHQAKEAADVDPKATLLRASDVDASYLPSALLSQAEHFEALFKLLNSPPAVSERIWDLIMRLPTNPHLSAQFADLTSASPGSVDWNQLLDAGSMYKLFYALQIVERHIVPEEGEDEETATVVDDEDALGATQELDEHELEGEEGGAATAMEGVTSSAPEATGAPPSTPKVSETRAAWRAAFVSHGGVSHLVDSVLMAYDFFAEDAGRLAKPALALVLTLLKEFAVDHETNKLVEGVFASQEAVVAKLWDILKKSAASADYQAEPSLADSTVYGGPACEAAAAAVALGADTAGSTAALGPVGMIGPQLPPGGVAGTGGAEASALDAAPLPPVTAPSELTAAEEAAKALQAKGEAATADAATGGAEAMDVAADSGKLTVDDQQDILESTRLVIGPRAGAVAEESASALAQEMASLLAERKIGEDAAVVNCVIPLLEAFAATNSGAMAAVIAKSLPELAEWMRVALVLSPDYGLRQDVSAFLLRLLLADPGALGGPLVGAAQSFLLADADSVSGQSIVNPTVKEFFGFLCGAVMAIASGIGGGTAAVWNDLFARVLETIVSVPIREQRYSTVEDPHLQGLLRLMTVLVRLDDGFKAQAGPTLIPELFHKVLFEIPSVENHGVFAPPKAKINPTRVAAMRLLVELGRGNEANFRAVTELFAAQHVTQERRTVWHYLPSNFEQSVSGYTGLRNLGATCYMNSLMQQFFMTPPFRYGLLQAPTDKADKGALDASADEEVLAQMKRLMGYLHESEKKYYDTKDFAGAYKDWDGQPMNPSVQMDVDEFFNMLADKLENGLKGSAQERLLKDVYGGLVVNQLISEDCPHYSEREETFLTVSLDVKNKKDIEESLELFVEGEMLEGDNKYKCEACAKHVTAFKRSCIRHLPNTLIVHLKRFEWDLETMKRIKVNDEWKFPMELNMQPYTREGLAQHDREADLGGIAARLQQLVQEDDANRPPEYYEYELAGVLVHTGSTEFGHYYSYAKERGAKIPGKPPRWIHFNDSYVEEFDPAEIPHATYGGVEHMTRWSAHVGKDVTSLEEKPYSAYMLFYERKTKFESPDPVSRSTTDPEAPPPSSVKSKPLTLSKAAAAPDWGPEASAQVPEGIFSGVWGENSKFLRDKTIFDVNYFDALWDTVALVDVPPVTDYAAPADPNHPAMRAAQVGVRFVVEVMSHAKEKASIHDWFLRIRMLFRNHLPAAKWFLGEMSRDTRWIRSMLLRCPVVAVRAAFARLIALALRLLRPHEAASFREMSKSALKVNGGLLTSAELGSIGGVPDVVPVRPGTPLGAAPESAAFAPSKPGVPTTITGKFMDSLLSVMPDAPATWRHFDHYFAVIADFAQVGEEERRFLGSRHIVARLGELLIGADGSPVVEAYKGLDVPPRKKVKLNDKFSRANLKALGLVVSLMARGSSTKDAPVGKLAPTHLGGAVIELSKYDLAMMSSAKFIAAMMKEDCNGEATGDLIQHVCWNSVQCTGMVLEVIAQAVDQEHSDVFRPFLIAAVALLDMKDERAQWRTETVLTTLLTTTHENVKYNVATWSCIEWFSLIVDRSQGRTLCQEFMWDNRYEWVEPYLLHGRTKHIRDCAAQILVGVVDESNEEQVYTMFVMLLDLMKTVEPLIGFEEITLNEHLHVSLQEKVIAYHKLAPYFRSLTRLCKFERCAQAFVPTWPVFWELLKGVDNIHGECDENKMEMTRLWEASIRVGAEHVLPLLTTDEAATARFFLFFLSLNSTERFLKYNREALPSYYSVMLEAARWSEDFSRVLSSQPNWEWAQNNLLAANDLYIGLHPLIRSIVNVLAERDPVWRVGRIRSQAYTEPLLSNPQCIFVLRDLVVTADDAKGLIQTGGLDRVVLFMKQRMEPRSVHSDPSAHVIAAMQVVQAAVSVAPGVWTTGGLAWKTVISSLGSLCGDPLVRQTAYSCVNTLIHAQAGSGLGVLDHIVKLHNDLYATITAPTINTGTAYSDRIIETNGAPGEQINQSGVVGGTVVPPPLFAWVSRVVNVPGLNMQTDVFGPYHEWVAGLIGAMGILPQALDLLAMCLVETSESTSMAHGAFVQLAKGVLAKGDEEGAREAVIQVGKFGDYVRKIVRTSPHRLDEPDTRTLVSDLLAMNVLNEGGLQEVIGVLSSRLDRLLPLVSALIENAGSETGEGLVAHALGSVRHSVTGLQMTVPEPVRVVYLVSELLTTAEGLKTFHDNILVSGAAVKAGADAEEVAALESLIAGFISQEG